MFRKINGADWEVAGAVVLQNLLNIEILAAVGIVDRHNSADGLVHLGAAEVAAIALAEIDRLADSELGDGQDGFDEFEDAQRVAAAIVPMLTLSWLCDSVLRLKTLAGMVSFRASAVRAEAEICMALKP